MKGVFCILVLLFFLQTSFAQTSSLAEDAYMFYNSQNYVSKVTKAQSNGDIINTYFEYPNDIISSYSTSCSYTSDASGLRTLVTKNIIKNPVEVYNTITNSSGTFVTGGELTTYDPSSPYPNAIFSLELPTPLDVSSFSPYHVASCSLVKDARYVLQESYDSYDIYGNLTQKTIKGGKIVSFIYDYKSAYKTAIIENAANNSVAYSSFETLLSTGNWIYSPTDDISLSGSDEIAGGGAYQFNPTNSITSPTLPQGNYIVSFWEQPRGSTGDITVTAVSGGGATPTVTCTDGPTVGTTWKYRECLITNAEGVTLSFTGGGNAWIDELRLYPQNAQMETIGYLPSIGVSYTCDVASHFNYYTYDDLNRLLYIKDEKGNITRQMEYGIQKPE
jgi:hypothetical protein